MAQQALVLVAGTPQTVNGVHHFQNDSSFPVLWQKLSTWDESVKPYTSYPHSDPDIGLGGIDITFMCQYSISIVVEV